MTSHTNALRYRLVPDEDALAAIEATFEAYHRMMEILDEVAPAEKGANLVWLHGVAYDKVRDATALPARMVTMGLGDRSDYRAAPERRLPLDDKTFNVKNATTVTVSTVRGRVTVPYVVAGYLPGWGHRAQAHLVRRDDGGFEIQVGVTPSIPEQENDLMTQAAPESLLSRAGRLIAGIAHEVIDGVEGKNRQAVVKRAIVEIEKAEAEARAELGRERAQEYRLNARRTEIDGEMKTLQAELDTALASGRDDLAKAGISRQLDLEAQLQVVATAMAETQERIGVAMTAIAATESALEEAQARLSDLQRSEAEADAASGAASGSPSGTSAAQKAARASRAVSRVVGVPASPAKPKELDELSRLHRAKEVDDRLARMKAEKGQG